MVIKSKLSRSSFIKGRKGKKKRGGGWGWRKICIDMNTEVLLIDMKVSFYQKQTQETRKQRKINFVVIMHYLLWGVFFLNKCDFNRIHHALKWLIAKLPSKAPCLISKLYISTHKRETKDENSLDLKFRKLIKTR